MEHAAVDFSLYKDALIVLGAAGVVVPLFHRLRLSPVLGYMLVGLVVGPFGLGALAANQPWLGYVTINDQAAIEPIAELGVVLLLFMIGLELSFERLWLMRRLVFGLGSLQVVACAGGIIAATLVLTHDPVGAVVAGLALAMSSTAVVLQVLSEDKGLNTPAGRAAFAILLFQDLSVVPVLFALGALAPSHAVSGMGPVVLAVAQVLLAVGVIIGGGRLVLRPLFRSVARTRSPELFIAACLFVVIATGLLTAAAGLSMALGALIGGLLLAGTEYRRQVEVTIEPFKGLLVGVFLISIGMSLNLRTLFAHPLLILAASIALVVGKAAIIAGLARGFRLPWTGGVRIGLLLGAGGEFSFVIVAVALAQGLLAQNAASLLLIITALTMAAIPLLSKLGLMLTPRLAGPRPIDPTLFVPEALELLPCVIIAGFGRVGQTVAALLDAHKIAYVAIDRDPDRVARQRRLSRPVYYGDITQIELLRRLSLDTARALVVTLDDTAAVDALVAGARAERADLMIVARARDASHAAHLYRIGASDAVPETVEASLQLSEAVLVDVGVPMGPVIVSIHEKREEFQAGIKAMAPEAEVRALGGRRLRDAVVRSG